MGPGTGAGSWAWVRVRVQMLYPGIGPGSGYTDPHYNSVGRQNGLSVCFCLFGVIFCGQFRVVLCVHVSPPMMKVKTILINFILPSEHTGATSTDIFKPRETCFLGALSKERANPAILMYRFVMAVFFVLVVFPPRCHKTSPVCWMLFRMRRCPGIVRVTRGQFLVIRIVVTILPV